MLNQFKRLALGALTALLCITLVSVQASAGYVHGAAELIPNTGDGINAFLFPVMGVLLCLSVILIIVYTVLASKKK